MFGGDINESENIRKVLKEEYKIPLNVRRRLPILKSVLHSSLIRSYPCDYDNLDEKFSQDNEFNHSNSKNYIDILENKIREQASTIGELQFYKTQFQNSLKISNSSLSLPFTHSHSKKSSTDLKRSDFNEEILHRQISQLKNMIALKDNVFI